jgi:hypothetical protein
MVRDGNLPLASKPLWCNQANTPTWKRDGIAGWNPVRGKKDRSSSGLGQLWRDAVKRGFESCPILEGCKRQGESRNG